MQNNLNKKYRPAIFIVVYKIQKEPVYLILKRKKHWTGWEFPKGGIDGKETEQETLVREISEETGLKIIKTKNHNIKGKYEYKKLLKDRQGIIGQTYSLHSAEVENGEVKIDKHEHTEYKWLNFQEARKILSHQNQKDCLEIVNEYLN